MSALPDVVGSYAARSAEDPESLSRALIRTKSRSGRDIMAALASGRRHSAGELEDIGRRYRQGQRPGLQLDPHRTLDLGRVIAVQTNEPEDRAAALGLMQWVFDEHRTVLTEREMRLMVQMAVKERDFALVETVMATPPTVETAAVATADLANPWIRGGDEARWVDALNAALFGPDIVQATLLPEGDTPFDRLTTTSDRRIDHDAKITVVISCYNPDRHLLTAVRSVVEQTWQNLELFVVDDASPAPLPGVLEQVEQLDPRVTVIRKAVNGGTYRARNTALRRATGDFFTCLDSDDWAHPQRLEIGVQPMLEDESLVATRSRGVRATEQMELSRVGYGSRFRAASSLMIRLFPVVNRVGFFDPVRKAADNEYALRVEAAFDGLVVDVPNHALTVLLADEGSLSASDYSSGWRHPARAEYSASYKEWHRQVQWRDSPMYLPPHGPRSFPAPRRWERHPQDGPPGSPLDVVVIADWRRRHLRPGTLDHVRGLLAEGRRVGVVHHETLLSPAPEEEPVVAALRELIRDGQVERVYLDDARHSRLTVVADPRVMQFPPLLDARLTSGLVAVVADREAEDARAYARTDVADQVRALLGSEPEWHDGTWPPAPRDAQATPPAGAGSVSFPDRDAPSADGDLEVVSWELREPADGERAALLSLVRAAETETEGPAVRELGEAWAAGHEPWELRAVDVLARHPEVWAVAVRTTSAVRLVVRPDVRADLDGRETVRLERPGGRDGVAELVVRQRGELLRRPILTA